MSDHPIFRNDLQSSREEQQGVVYYRIEDTATETSFRLYEIEYLIAQKFDGSRTLDEVISAVKGEFNFDISLADLQRFLSQLESMGFMAQVAEVPEAAPTQSVSPESDMPELEVAVDFDPAEEKRLLTNALLHVKQGYIPHARDYFLAARELNPSNSALTQVINHLEIVGDDPTSVEISYIWEQIQEVLPELAAEVGAPSSKDSGLLDVNDSYIEEVSEQSKAPFWIVAFLLVLAASGAGVWYFFPGLLQTAVSVTVGTPVVWAEPLYFADCNGRSDPVTKRRLSFAISGKVAKLRATPHQVVSKGDVLAYLKIPRSFEKKLAAALKGVDRARGAIRAAKSQQDAIASKIEELSGLKGDAMADLKKAAGGTSPDKKMARSLKKRVAKLGQEIRRVRQKQSKVKRAHAGAKRKEAMAQKSLSKVLAKGPVKKATLVAPLSGVIATVNITEGGAVARGKKAIEVIDPAMLLISFELAAERAGAFNVAMGVQVVVDGDKGKRAVSGTVEQVKDLSDGQKSVAVKLADPTGSIYRMKAASLHLGIPEAGIAHAVPRGAIATKEAAPGAATLWLVDDGKLVDKRVQLVFQRGEDAVVIGLSGSEQVVVAVGEGGEFGLLEIGQKVDVAP